MRLEVLTKQIAMRTCAFKALVGAIFRERIFFRERIYQPPVRFQMAVAAAGEVAAQGMILVLRRQLVSGNPVRASVSPHWQASISPHY